jgi:hypothetical protein
MLQEPGYLFRYTPTSHLPSIQPYKGISITPLDSFTVLMLLKAYHYRKRIDIVLKLPFAVLMLYFLFSFITGIIFYSYSLDDSIWFLRPIFYSSWLVIFVALVDSREKIFKFFMLLFPVIFFILFTQFYFLINGIEFISMLDYYARQEIATNTLTGTIRLIAGGENLLLFCYMGSLFFIQYGKSVKEKPYYYIIAAGIFLSIFISASRALFGLYLFITVGTFFRKIKDLPKNMSWLLLVVIILLVLIKLEVFSEEYLKESIWGRVSQVFDIFKGKGKEIDTVGSRLIGFKEMLKVVKKEPILGYGFSETSRMYYDNDLGFVNTILMFGVVGLILFICLYVSYIKMMLFTLRVLGQDDALRECIRVSLVTFLAFLIGYCFTIDLFTPFYFQYVALITIFFAISNIFVKESLLEKENHK